MEPTEPTEPQKRRSGRPKRADAPTIPWITVDKILVFGEREVDPASGGERIRYPSLAELATRYGVSRTLMWKYAHKHKVYERRRETQLKTDARTEAKVIEKLSSARANAAADVIGVIDQFMLRFQSDLLDGRVKTDSAADFDRMARLRELMSGGADARLELQGGLTLEAIQARHRAVRSQVAQLTPAIAGTAESGVVTESEDRPSTDQPSEAELRPAVERVNAEDPGALAMDAELGEDEVDPQLGASSELAADGAP
jgi:hypothetical protein